MGKTELECDCDIVHEENVRKAKKCMCDENKLKLMADFYKAWSDNTRIRIINILEKNELCVCDIAVILNMTKSAISHQLKYLKNMNIVKNRKVGKEVLYTLSDLHVRQIFNISCKHISHAGGCRCEN